MNLKHLRHFVAIVDKGTFLAAAESIPISQPALTRSLQVLEHSLGVSLLDRHTRGVQMTDAGQRLYGRAKFILSEAARAVDDVQNAQLSQSLNIGIAPMFAGHYMPRILRELYTQNPHVQISVVSDLFQPLTQRLMRGDIDVMVANLPVTALPDDLAPMPLLDITIGYIASTEHPLASQTLCQFEDLAQYPWATVDELHANDLYSYIFATEGKVQSPIRLRTNSLSLLKSIIEKPPYITLLPEHMVKAEVKQGTLCVLKVRQDGLKRKGGLVCRKRDVSRPALEQFKTIFQDYVNSHSL